ncbi:MAG: hypothetical protein LUE17_10050 [Planctomycetaceae bacterium]|nr:hypothetical protein [Planctomycetaceae bacterium]
MNASDDSGGFSHHVPYGFTIPLLCSVAFWATLTVACFAHAGENEGDAVEDPIAQLWNLGAELSAQLRLTIDSLEQILPQAGGAYTEIMAFRHAHVNLVHQARRLCQTLPRETASRPQELDVWLDRQLGRYNALTDRCTILTARLGRAVLARKAAGTEKQDTMAVLQLESISGWLADMTMEIKILAAGLEVVYDNRLFITGSAASEGAAVVLDQAEKRMASVQEQLRFRCSTRDSMSEMIRSCPGSMAGMAMESDHPSL